MLNPNLYNTIRLVAVAITLVALLGQYYLPKKSFVAIPGGDLGPGLASDGDQGGPSRAMWLDELAHRSLCQLRFTQHGFSHCSMSFTFGATDTRGLDLSDYEGFYLKLNYKGRADRLRLYMRNYNPAFSSPEVGNSSKFVSLMIRTRDLDETIYIKFSEFQVADWWESQFDLDRELLKPRFNNVVVLGVDYLDEGDHVAQIEKMEFVGDWIDTEKFLLIIIFVWIAVALWEGLSRLYYLSSKSKMDSEIISELVGSYSQLEVEKQEYEKLSKRDTLTGVLNRYGFLTSVEPIFDDLLEKCDAILMVIDIDHFKQINDNKGHNAGDQILEQICDVFIRNTRQGDIIGRWGGEEFVIFCRRTNIFDGVSIGENLRKKIMAHNFVVSEEVLKATVSIGMASIDADDVFEDVFKRADEALYKAKHAGRNCVKTEED